MDLLKVTAANESMMEESIINSDLMMNAEDGSIQPISHQSRVNLHSLQQLNDGASSRSIGELHHYSSGYMPVGSLAT